MGLFRKDRHSHDSAQENLEHFKKSHQGLAPWDQEELQRFNSNLNKQNWAESPPDNNRYSVQNYGVADYVREQEEKARYEKYHDLQSKEELRAKILSKTPARQTDEAEQYLVKTIEYINTYFSD